MAKIEISEEFFYPAPVRKGNSIVPAPPEAVEKRDKLRNGWLMKYCGFSGWEPLVSLSPGEKDGKPGYFVQKEIVSVGNNENTQESRISNDWLN